MTTPGPTTQDVLDERYGRGRTASRRRRWTIGIAASIGVIAVGLFGWMTVASQLDAVNAETTGFEIVDEHSVVLRFQVTAPIDRSIACALEAQDEEHGIVGWRVVEYPGSELHARGFREVVPTTAAATTGLVNSCWVLPR
jgi:hypothetical protein